MASVQYLNLYGAATTTAEKVEALVESVVNRMVWTSVVCWLVRTKWDADKFTFFL